MSMMQAVRTGWDLNYFSCAWDQGTLHEKSKKLVMRVLGGCHPEMFQIKT